ncbi:alkaline phosphatase [Rhodococcus rhodnii LMG 5362]|uniref:Alkaline phosphatase n=1 Tax=Rhodococcus rhodnii LMG 5362 TaxID=1273125 RepID=R7WH46_9NOCA|nr:alkaline phosphatase [Rhodococcus rhodnii LMG 5362]
MIAPDRSIRLGTTRRQFLTWSALVGAAAATPSLLGAPVASAQGFGSLGGSAYPFTLGVASGDPLPDAVVIWTRLAPDPLEPGGGMPALPISVRWEVAEDERFAVVVAGGKAWAHPESAHSVHVDVRGLAPRRTYFYRFHALGHTSAVARTTTLPAMAHLAFAWASCQAWHDGYYTVYDDMAAQDLDVVFHLGDYIYEGELKNTSVRDVSRLSPQVRKETEALDDYRLRYSLYKSDPSLQAAHAVAPWVVTMDDHEVDNNWAASVSQDDDDPVQFLQRRAQAFRAWWEHTPTRITAPTGPDMTIYRRIGFGDLAEFSVLDTRQYRSDQANGDGEHEQNEQTADPARTITGQAQESWILDGLAASRATWNVLAHQTVMTDLARENGGVRTVGMDGWSGYEASRHRVLGGARERGVSNLMSIVGDIHRTVVAELREDYRTQSPVVGVEIAGTSIASAKDGEDVDDAHREFAAANPSIKFGNKQRGYVHTVVTREQWQSTMRVTDRVTEPGHPTTTRAMVTVPAGRPEIQV